MSRYAFVLACMVMCLSGVDGSCLCGTCCPYTLDRTSGLCLNQGTPFCSMGCPGVPTVAVPLCPRRGLSMQPRGVSGQASNVRVVETFVRNSVRVWAELVDAAQPGFEARLHNVPAYYDHFDYSLSVPLSTRIASNMEYNFRCGLEACEVVIFLYECHPCPSNKGGLPARLLGDGFVRTRCAPTFTNGQTNTQHQLVAYSKLIDTQEGGQFVYSFVSDSEIDFLLAAFSEDARLMECEGRSKSECDASYDRCVYRGGRCQRNTCISRGPGTGCNTNTCLKKELRFA